jgi:hypothetical protein
MNDIKVIVFVDGSVVISIIEEVSSDLGEPDCKLINPFKINMDGTLSSWLSDFSSQKNFMIHSDKILTIADPKTHLIEKYQNFVK